MSILRSTGHTQLGPGLSTPSRVLTTPQGSELHLASPQHTLYVALARAIFVQLSSVVTQVWWDRRGLLERQHFAHFTLVLRKYDSTHVEQLHSRSFWQHTLTSYHTTSQPPYKLLKQTACPAKSSGSGCDLHSPGEKLYNPHVQPASLASAAAVKYMSTLHKDYQPLTVASQQQSPKVYCF